jgi:hypothetical protein
MGSPAEPLHQSKRSGQPEQSSQGQAPEPLTEFDSESVIATRRLVIDADAPRGDRQIWTGWGYVALVAAFLLGVCAALIAMLVW